MQALFTERCRMTAFAFGLTLPSASAASRPASTLSEATWETTSSGSLTGASTMITGMPFRFASIRLPRTPSQFTGLMKRAAGCCWSTSEMSFFCLRLLNWASSITSRSPCDSITPLRPSSRSMKKGLFIVWTETPNSRPPAEEAGCRLRGGRRRGAGWGSPPQPDRNPEIRIVASPRWHHREDFMLIRWVEERRVARTRTSRSPLWRRGAATQPGRDPAVGSSDREYGSH